MLSSLAGRHLRRAAASMTAAVTAGGVMLVGLPVATDSGAHPADLAQARADARPVEASHAPNSPAPVRPRAAVQYRVLMHPHKKRRISPDKRRIIRYTVRRGDTASGLAVRFHAWTAEVVAMNGPVLRVGERIRIPVVVAAAARDRRAQNRSRAEASHGSRSGKKAAKSGKQKAGKQKAKKKRVQKKRATTAKNRRKRARQEASARPSRAVVRRVVARTARRHGVDPQLALAVAWQESGWQMHLTSSAGAVGAMQVIPSTGRWMSDVVGRRLDLRDLRDNATAGVVYLKMLLSQARYRRAVAGYYQGLAGVRRHGMYSDTRRYVANVGAIRRQFERGHYPV